jgi:hypothetical protein
LLFELGWEKLPTLQFLSWQAQWTDFYRTVRANLSLPALTIPVFNNSLMQGNGILSNLTLPPIKELRAQYDVFELDFALGCPSPFQESCAIWVGTRYK